MFPNSFAPGCLLELELVIPFGAGVREGPSRFRYCTWWNEPVNGRAWKVVLEREGPLIFKETGPVYVTAIVETIQGLHLMVHRTGFQPRLLRVLAVC